MSSTNFKTQFFGVIVLDEVVKPSNSKELASYLGRTRQRRIPAVDDGLVRLVENLPNSAKGRQYRA